MTDKNESLASKGLLASAKDQQRTKAPDFVSKYANNVSVAMTNWDISIMFGRVKGDNQVEETVEIIVSKEIAKAVALMMSANIKKYEEAFGEIKLFDPAELKKLGVPVKEAAMPMKVAKAEKAKK